MAEAVAPTAAPGLRKDAIGLREVLFQSMTDMAPGAAIAASIPFGVAYAGGALPLSVLIAMVACLLTAFCIGELAKNLPGAGSLGLYVSQGLHTSLGFLTSWAYLLIGLLISPLVLLQLGFTTASTIHDEWSSYPANLWSCTAVIGALIVVAAGLYGIRTRARPGRKRRGEWLLLRHTHVGPAGHGDGRVRDRRVPGTLEPERRAGRHR